MMKSAFLPLGRKISSRAALVALIAAVGLFAGLPIQSARAASEQIIGVKVQPSIIEERAEPGKTLSFVLHATNIGEASRTFYVLKNNIRSVDSNGKPAFAKEGEPTGLELTSWIDVTNEPITIGAGMTKDIPFSINVSKDATPGAHLGSISLSTEAERPKETGIGIGYQVATIINLRISGDVIEEAQIREFRSDKMIYSKPEVKFLVRVDNLGNTVSRPRGPLEILNLMGKKTATLIMNDSGAAILPKATRGFEAEWKGGSWSFGRYQAVLSLVFGEDGNKTISNTLSFWVLPLNIIIPVAGGLIGLIIFLYFFIKINVKRKLKRIRDATSGAGSGISGLDSRVSGDNSSRMAITIVILLLILLVFLVGMFFFFA